MTPTVAASITTTSNLTATALSLQPLCTEECVSPFIGSLVAMLVILYVAFVQFPPVVSFFRVRRPGILYYAGLLLLVLIDLDDLDLVYRACYTLQLLVIVLYVTNS